jgi:tryptophanase
MSAKKDALVNIGGFLALNDDDAVPRKPQPVVLFEGLHTYGGLAGRDMEAMAIGIRESVDEDHIRASIGQVFYLGQKLAAAGMPIVKPIGTARCFLDAKALPAPPAATELSPRRHWPRRTVPRCRHPRDGARHCLGAGATPGPARTIATRSSNSCG